MGLREGLARWLGGEPKEERADPTLGMSDWLSYFNFGGLSYPFLQPPLIQTYGTQKEEPPYNFEGYVQAIYKSNGIVFACMLARMLLFSEARFQFRQLRNGRPGDLFGTSDLTILEKPWPGGTTGDLLGRAIQDVDIAGNYFATRRGAGRGNRIVRLRPDWTTIIAGSMSDPEATGWELDAEILGYLYQPGGPGGGHEPVALGREEVAHFAPIPDPLFRFRGMSWLTPVIRETMADGAATTHKLKFFEQGATANMVVTLDAAIKREEFERWVELFERKHTGLLNAYKTMYMGGGGQAKVVGADMHQMDFKQVQGAGETRIAAAAGVPPVIVGLSEGLQAATYSNYAQARRRFADGTMRPLWRNAAGSLSVLVPPPPGAELWYDDRDIPFLAEDRKDAAEILQAHATTISTLVNAGYKPETVVDAVLSGDFSRLVHTGLYSVQLQPAGTTPAPALPAPAKNGPPTPAA